MTKPAITAQLPKFVFVPCRDGTDAMPYPVRHGRWNVATMRGKDGDTWIFIHDVVYWQEWDRIPAAAKQHFGITEEVARKVQQKAPCLWKHMDRRIRNQFEYGIQVKELPDFVNRGGQPVLIATPDEWEAAKRDAATLLEPVGVWPIVDCESSGLGLPAAIPEIDWLTNPRNVTKLYAVKAVAQELADPGWV